MGGSPVIKSVCQIFILRAEILNDGDGMILRQAKKLVDFAVGLKIQLNWSHCGLPATVFAQPRSYPDNDWDNSASPGLARHQNPFLFHSICTFANKILAKST